MKARRWTRRGSVLSVVLTVAAIVGLLGLSLVDRSIRSSRTAGWTRDHLVLRSIAESAAEELARELQQKINDPEHSTFRTFRALSTRKFSGCVTVTDLKPREVSADIKGLEKSTGMPIRLTHSVKIRELKRVSADPYEWCGVVQFDVTASSSRPILAVSERVKVDRGLRVARVTLPAMMDQCSLLIQSAPGGVIPQVKEKSAAYSLARQGSRTLREILTSSHPERLRPIATGLLKELAKSSQTLSPREVFDRAQFVTMDAHELRKFLDHHQRRGKRMSGVVGCRSRDPVKLGFPSFSGNLLIASSAPVIVDNIKLADPDKDSLTIVSEGKIMVCGTSVEASLVSLGHEEGGVFFTRPAEVIGTIVSHELPQGYGLSESELEGVRLSAHKDRHAGDELKPVSDGSQPTHYAAFFSPYPLATVHLSHPKEDGQ